jgi:hypothetical protein
MMGLAVLRKNLIRSVSHEKIWTWIPSRGGFSHN